MKISKKLMLLLIPALLFLSSCELFKGGGKCDCPKFGEVPVNNGQPDGSSHS